MAAGEPDAADALLAGDRLEMHPVRLEGVVKSVVFEAKDDTYKVLSVEVSKLEDEVASRQAARKPSTGTVYVCGKLPHVATGFGGRFAGTWKLHEKYGRQLQASAFEEMRPKTVNNLVKYLQVTHDELFKAKPKCRSEA